MFKVHGYLGEKCVIDWRMQHLPRKGDTVRLSEEQFATVTEVVWCIDEDSLNGQRVNLRMEPLKDETYELGRIQSKAKTDG